MAANMDVCGRHRRGNVTEPNRRTRTDNCRFVASFRIHHPVWSAMEITAGMGEAPDISWTAGESRTTPKGRPLDGTYYSTYWSKELETDGFRSVAEFVESHLDRIQPRRAFLDRLLESGGSAAYFIGIFLDANYGESLTWTLSRRLADYRIDLLLDLYPPQGSKVAPEP